MVNIRGTRRFRLAVGLICEKLEIDNKELDAFIVKKKRSNSVVIDPEPPINVKETAKLINAITDHEELKQFDSDERKGVISVLVDRRKELGIE